LPIAFADIEIFAILNRQSAIGNRQSSIGNRQSSIGLIKVLRTTARDNIMASDRFTIAS
jgi:hypothetical protein